MTRILSWLVASVLLVLASPALAADSLESVEKKLDEIMAAHKSMQFKMKSTHDLSHGAESVKSDTESTAQYERRPEKSYVSRIEAKSTIVQKTKDDPEKKIKTETLTVVDGKYWYILSRSEENTSAVKRKLDPKTSIDPFDLAGQLKVMRKDFNLKLLPDETVDGKSCYAIEATPKDPEKTADIMASSVTFYDKKSGLGLKTVSYDKTGKVTSTSVISEIKLDADIPDDRFAFKAPAGVQVVDLSESAQPAGGDNPSSKPADKTSDADRPAEKPASSDTPKKDPAGKALKGLLKGLGR